MPRPGESLSRGAPTGHPSRPRRRRAYGLRSTSWTTDQRCASSSPPAAPASPPTQVGLPTTGAAAACPGCGAARSRPSPGSAWSTTPGSSAARSPAPPPACSTRWRAPCSSTRPNARTCSTSPAPPTASPPRAGRDVVRRARPPSRPSLQWALEAITDGVAFVRDPRQNLLATNALGPRVLLTGHRRRRPHPEPRPVPVPRPRRRATSTPTGSCSPRCASASCAPRPAATRTTAACRTWSASCPPAARPSAGCGPPTTCAPTAPAPSASTTPSSASSPSPTRSSPSPPSPGSCSWSTPPSPARPPPNASACSPPGRRRSRRPPPPPSRQTRRGTDADHPQLHRHRQGPADWFTGDVYIDSVAAARAVPGHGEPGALHARRPHRTGTATRWARPSTSPRASDCASAAADPIEVIRPGDRVSSRPTRSTGTAPRRTGSWCTSPSTRATTSTRSSTGSARHRRGVRRPAGASVARVFVTGSSGGLGRETATALLDQGHRVIVHARDVDRLATPPDLRDRGAAARRRGPRRPGSDLRPPWPTRSTSSDRSAQSSTMQASTAGNRHRPARSTSWLPTSSPP